MLPTMNTIPIPLTLPKVVVKAFPRVIPKMIKHVNPTKAIITAVNKIILFEDPYLAALPNHIPEWADFDPIPTYAEYPQTLVERLEDECRDLMEYSVWLRQMIGELKDMLDYEIAYLEACEWVSGFVAFARIC